MMTLDPSRRQLYTQVERVIRSNPFGDERDALDAALLAATGGGFTRVDQWAAAEWATLRSEAAHRPKAYAAEDGEHVLSMLLFHAYHHAAPLFDALIADQERQGDDACPVPFATACMEAMTEAGVSDAEAQRYFELFYQLRRAYYFIASELTGTSACMRDLRCRLWENLFTTDVRQYERFLWRRMEEFSTLLLGETGTGKGSAAAAIGRSGFIPFDRRRGCFAQSFSQAFVSITLSEFPEALIESELFGHRRGAFTGAVDHHQGILERCSAHGAVLLDEIGDVPPPVQVKLLQVLQTRTFSPVGSHEKRRFGGRVIAATHRPIDLLRRDGRFRQDFYYRLCSDRLELPPLRQRLAESPDDLQLLTGRILTRLCGPAGQALVGPVAEALRRDTGPDYRWPGNVRELEQAVRQTLLRGHYHPPAPDADAPDGADPYAGRIARGELDARGLLAGYCRQLHAQFGTYGAVARRTGLDWRTVRKYVTTD